MFRRSLATTLVCLLSFSALPALAATFITSDDDPLTISASVQGDAYILGGLVNVEEAIMGDAIIAAGEVNVSAPIRGDLMIGAGKIVISGPVGDDVRVAAGEVKISGTVSGDVLVAGGRVDIEKSAVILGDLFVAGGEVDIDGTLKGVLRVEGGSVVLRGKMGKEVRVAADSLRVEGAIEGETEFVTKSVVLGSAAAFRKNIRYWNENGEIDFGSALKGNATFDVALIPFELIDDATEAGFEALMAAIKGILFGYSLLATAFILFLFVAGTRTFFTDAGKTLLKSPWPSFFTGFIYFAVTPVICFIFLLTVVGIPVSLILFGTYLVTLYLLSAIASLVLARYIEQYYKMKWGKVRFYFAALGIFIALKFITLIPLVGLLIKALIVVTAFGAFLMTKWQKAAKIL